MTNRSHPAPFGETPAWTEGVGLRGTEVMLIAVADPSAAGVRSVVSALA